MPDLHDYQKVAVQHLENNPKAGLFLDMGLGKTAIVLRTLTPDRLPAIVIAPKRVAENVWESEADIWRPDLDVQLAVGSPKKRQVALESDADVVVVGRDNIKDVPMNKFRTVVLDELSGFKSHRSQRWKTAKKLTEKARYVWGLTGTPSPNGLMDLWAQMYLLDRGERLEKFITRYRNRYFTPGRQLRTGVIIEWDLKPEADKRIHEKIDDICLSMSSEGRIKLPDVVENMISVPLPAKAMKVYKALKRDLVADLEIIGGEVHTAKNAAVLSAKLSQISAGFIYSDEMDSTFTKIHDEKMKAVLEVVEGTGSPILLFYRFKVEKNWFLHGIPGCHSIDEKGVIPAWNRGEVPVLLAHPASAGYGLNLQKGGHTIVWASMPWSLEEYMQSNGRLNRQGQKSSVVIHHLVSPGTVDEAIHVRLKEKKSVQDALLEHLEIL